MSNYYVSVVQAENMPQLPSSLRGKISKRKIYCSFKWLDTMYQSSGSDTTVMDSCDSNSKFLCTWNEEFVLPRVYGARSILCVYLHDGATKPAIPIGKVNLDLSAIKKSRPSDGWYPLAAITDAPLSVKGGRIRLFITPISVDDPDFRFFSANNGDAKLDPNDMKLRNPNVPDVDPLPDPKIDKKAKVTAARAMLRQAHKGRSVSSEAPADFCPKPGNLAKFWELKSLFPTLPDYRIHMTLEENGGDECAAIQVLQARVYKAARDIGTHLVIDVREEVEESPATRKSRIEQQNMDYKKMMAGEAVTTEAVTGLFSAMQSDHMATISVKKAKRERRKALLIGCDYTANQKISLKGVPLNDVKFVKYWLNSVWDFAAAEGTCATMADDHGEQRCIPTRENVIGMLNWLADGAEPGDALFLYFQGRGGVEEVRNQNRVFPYESYWTTVDGGKVTLTDIYFGLICKLPKMCRLTVLVDCDEFFSAAPFVFSRHHMKLCRTNMNFPVACDVHWYCSLGSPTSVKGATFTQLFLLLSTQLLQVKNGQDSYYDFMYSLEVGVRVRCLQFNGHWNPAMALFDKIGVYSGHCSFAQESDLRRPFSLIDIVPNTNQSIGTSSFRNMVNPWMEFFMRYSQSRIKGDA